MRKIEQNIDKTMTYDTNNSFFLRVYEACLLIALFVNFHLICCTWHKILAVVINSQTF